jgi:lysophospholipase L1-like esterase
LLLALLAGLCGPADAAAQAWQGAWGHPPTAYNQTMPQAGRPSPLYAPLPAYDNVTVREVVRLSAGAHAIRLRFTNEFGTQPLHIGAARIALSAGDGATVAATDHIITFDGHTAVDIPPGAPMLSDPIAWDLPPLTRLSVSLYYPAATVPPAHTLFTLDSWQAGSPGDFTAATTMPGAAPARCGIHLSEIDVIPAQPGATLVAFGDSITEGVVSTKGAFRAWPDILAERLQADARTRGWSVVNAGVGSNRLLHDTPSANALARFDRDVLSVPAVKAVIVLLGINDIQYSHRYPEQAVHAPAETAALAQLIARAHAAGIRIYGATVTPFGGSPDYTPEGEADRQAINAFVRSGAFDGVVDFDAMLRDPSQPARLRADVESSGHLHPNDRGYAAMGNGIDLSLFEAAVTAR